MHPLAYSRGQAAPSFADLSPGFFLAGGRGCINGDTVHAEDVAADTRLLIVHWEEHLPWEERAGRVLVLTLPSHPQMEPVCAEG